MTASPKSCFRCHEAKPISEFYVHPGMTDGHLGKCKNCTRRDMKLTRRSNQAEIRRRERESYHNDPERRRQTIANAAESKRRHPDRVRASRLVCQAVRDGRLVRQPCEVCGATKVEGHHDDYSKPLSVRWLCRDHHEECHHPVEIPF